MKKLIVALLALLLMTGCTRTAKNEGGRDGYYEPSGDFSKVTESVGNKYNNSNEYAGEMLVYTSNISLETTDYKKTTDELNELMTRFKAFTQSIDERNGSRRSMNMVIRVPSKDFDSFIQALRNSDAVSVTGISTNVDNITTTYNDNEIRITALETQHARLLELLAEAKDLTDVIKIEQRLSEVEIELTKLKSNRGQMENEVAYATVGITIYEVTTYSEVSFLQKIVNAFSGSWSSFTASVQDFLISLIYALPHLVVLAVAFLVLRKPVGALLAKIHWPFKRKKKEVTNDDKPE